MSLAPARISYPGLGACLSADYTASLGISPGIATVSGVLGDTAPAAEGDLTIAEMDVPVGKPVVSLTLRDCRLDQVQGGYSGAGNRVQITLYDRRWRWLIGPGVRGHYNQLDRRGKLIPWTVRSPHQLAVILLEAMGEKEPTAGWASVINLPGGLAAKHDSILGIPVRGPLDVLVDPAQDYLNLGQNLPPSGSNPAVVWADEPAAVCLSRFTDQFGRSVCFNPLSNTVSIVRLGDGPGLPDGAVDVRQEGVDLAESPAIVRIVGSPTRFQVRLVFRAVAPDWDGSWRPLDELSYAPGAAGTTDRWAKCPPPLFPTVLATDRLSYHQAAALAQKSVFRCYQLVAQDAADPTKWAVRVPGLDPNSVPPAAGEVDNRFRLVVLPTRPEQTAPRPADTTRLDPAAGGRPYAREFYDGYSQDRPAQAYASVFFQCAHDGLIWASIAGFDADNNSPANAPVYVPFRVVDPERQVIAFDRAVYRWESNPTPGGPPVPGGLANASFRAPRVVVETGVLVLDAATNDPVRHAVEVAVPGGTGPKRSIRVEQVQRDVIGEYAADHTLTGWHDTDAYATEAGRYYAEAIRDTYQLTGAATNTYVGLVPVNLGGRVRQVSWSVGEQGRVTTASLNTEHSTTVLPYPARRRKENLPPDPLEAFLNAFGAGAGAVWGAANAAGRFARALFGPGGRG